MIRSKPREDNSRSYLPWLLIASAVSAALALGYVASVQWVLLLAVGFGMLILMRWPRLGLPLIVATAVLVRYDIDTGTAVSLNPTALLVPTLFIVWLVSHIIGGGRSLAPSRTTLPLFLFLLSLLVSLLIGVALWDPLVPRAPNFMLVQLAQWGLFAASAMAFLLVGNIIVSVHQLRWLTYFSLVLLGTLAVLWSIFPFRNVAVNFLSLAIIRAPYWPLVTALAAGQLFFNERLAQRWKLFCVLIVAAVLSYTFVQEVLLRERAVLSGFIGVAIVLAVLSWLRFKRLRWLILFLAVILLLSGLLGTFAYDVVGGDDEWLRSGGSRLALIQRVLEVSLRNPITGLGPAAYRLYANMEPLAYRHILWLDPRISAHNNYVDLFAHGGLLGISFFLWFMFELFRLVQRLRHRFAGDFAEGYVNAMLATWAAMLGIMLLADWFLPFVYNISFAGFQASALVWMFFGGLVALEQIADPPAESG